MRGEYQDTGYFCGPASELPPRTRRIPGVRAMEALGYGTTSACAENTLKTRTERVPLGNYLRVRGEYEISEGLFAHVAELPPRARRIHVGCAGELNDFGTTSACAENTFEQG